MKKPIGFFFFIYLRNLASQLKMLSRTFTTSNFSLPVGCSSLYPYGFNGKEKDDEISGSGNHLDFGSRGYDPRLGKWWSIDPLFKTYPHLSPYNFAANNPIYFIDIDGEKIIVPEKADRTAVLKMINSKAAGTFGINAKGELYVIKKEGAKGFSTYYRDQLIAGIEADKTIDINIKNKIGKRPTLSGDGKSMVKDNGEAFDVDKKSSGGVTFGKNGTNQIVYISGNENKNLKDTEGKPLEDKPADILAHELVGHAVPKLLNKTGGNAVEDENKVRKETGSKLREASPAHKESTTGNK